MDVALNYKLAEVKTADSKKLVVMLYEGAISFLKIAKDRLLKNDMAAKGIYIGKAQDIILELNSSLDMKRGGKIARSLRNLYLFMNRTLIQANIQNDPKKIENVIEILEKLLPAWKEAEKKLRK